MVALYYYEFATEYGYRIRPTLDNCDICNERTLTQIESEQDGATPSKTYPLWICKLHAKEFIW